MKLTRVTLATASSVLLLATLAACGGSSDDTATDSTGAQDATQEGPGGQFGGDGQLPGASGEVAAVSGRTAQVQSDISGQVAVSWTSSTTFTRQVDGSLDDVQVGSCVMVTSADADTGGATSQPTEVTAATVRVVDTSNGDGCGFSGPGDRQAPSGAPSDPPSDGPSDPPSDASGGPGGGRPGGFGTFGEVTAVSGDGFTVSVDDTDVTVTVSGDTTYTTTAKASADAVKVGACVSARGDTDDTGALTATSISVSEKVDGQCTGGFVGRPAGVR
jgi:hypothetical protein